jgi:TolB protein
MLGSILMLAALQGAQMVTLQTGARDPAWSADGRLAVSLRGDVWVYRVSTDGRVTEATHLTRGPAWDREPAWSPDGRFVVFTSDRSGNADIWRVDADGSREPERLTTDAAPEGEATVGPDGAILFVRGAGALADLWQVGPDGRERSLTNEPGADRSPAISRDGALAWVRERGGTHALVVRSVAADTGSVRTLVSDRTIGRVAWSPSDRLAFTSDGRTAGVWVISRNGDAPVMAATSGQSVTWSPDGRMLAIGTTESVGVGYKGDPDRLGDRSAGDVQD